MRELRETEEKYDNGDDDIQEAEEQIQRIDEIAQKIQENLSFLSRRIEEKMLDRENDS